MDSKNQLINALIKCKMDKRQRKIVWKYVSSIKLTEWYALRRRGVYLTVAKTWNIDIK